MPLCRGESKLKRPYVPGPTHEVGWRSPYPRDMTAQLPPDSPIPEVGSLVGSWLVQARMGSGSHGVVFRVVSAQRPGAGSFALKLAREPSDPRFEREAWLLAHIRHASVPRFEDEGVWTSPGGYRYPYVVMEWVEGVPLYEWAEQYGLTLRQAIGQLAQLARALDATHPHGVHRDVKGGNVRVTPEGRAMLLDFGSGWYRRARKLTEGAMPPGTDRYRSPQLLFYKYALRRGAGKYYEGESSDDVYALGVTAYRLLAGAYPPRGPDSDSEEDSDPPPLVAPRGLKRRCPELAALVLRLLAEDPEARGSAKQVARELGRLFKLSSPALDLIWVERVSTDPLEKPVRPAPLSGSVLRTLARRATLAAVFIVLGALGALLTRNLQTGPVSAPQGTGSPDAGSVGMGEDAMASVTPAEAPPSSDPWVSRPMPTEPLPGQKRSPCNQRGAKEINGGCWANWVGAETAPCDKDKYEYKGRCYVPIMLSGGQPTSEEPR